MFFLLIRSFIDILSLFSETIPSKAYIKAEGFEHSILPLKQSKVANIGFWL